MISKSELTKEKLPQPVRGRGGGPKVGSRKPLLSGKRRKKKRQENERK